MFVVVEIYTLEVSPIMMEIFPITLALCFMFFSPYYADNYAGLIDAGLAASIQKHTFIYIKHPREDANFVSRQLQKICHTIHLLAFPFTLVASLHINFEQCIQ